MDDEIVIDFSDYDCSDDSELTDDGLSDSGDGTVDVKQPHASKKHAAAEALTSARPTAVSSSTSSSTTTTSSTTTHPPASTSSKPLFPNPNQLKKMPKGEREQAEKLKLWLKTRDLYQESYNTLVDDTVALGNITHPHIILAALKLYYSDRYFELVNEIKHPTEGGLIFQRSIRDICHLFSISPRTFQRARKDFEQKYSVYLAGPSSDEAKTAEVGEAGEAAQVATNSEETMIVLFSMN